LAHSSKENLTEIISILTGLIGILGGLCAFIVPTVLLVGLGIFLFRRNQQGCAAKAAAKSWSSAMGTVLMSSVQSSGSGNGPSIYLVVVYQYR